MNKKPGRSAIYTPEEARLRRNAFSRKYYANSTSEKKLWKTFSFYMSKNLKKRFATQEELEAMLKKDNKYAENRRNSSNPETWSNFAFSHYNSSHKKLIKKGKILPNSKYDLTREWIFNHLKKQNFKCAETGINFTFGTSNCPNKPSFDRIDNTKGYLKSNLRLVTTQTNVSRNDMSVEEHILRQVLVAKRIEKNNPEMFKSISFKIESEYGYALL